jgi:hypothetical protein
MSSFWTIRLVSYSHKVWKGACSLTRRAVTWRKKEKLSVDGPQGTGYSLEVVGSMVFFFGGKLFDGSMNSEFACFDSSKKPHLGLP